MDKHKIKIALGLLFGTLLVAASIVAWIHIQSVKDSKTPQTYYLGDPNWTGYVGVTVTYDKEPVDVTLLSPDGTAYGFPKNFFGKTRNADVYEHDEENKQITVLVDTDTPGAWNVMFPRLSNTRIHYSFVTRLSPTLYLHGGNQIITEDDKHYLSFMAVMDAKETDTCRYTVQLDQNQYSRIIATGDVPYNKQVKIEIQPPPERYDGTEYVIKLSVSAPPKSESDPNARPRTAHTSFKVLLNPGETATDDKSSVAIEL